MDTIYRAHFVKSPRRADELQRPHRIEDERPYRITVTVTLSAMDYENFAEGMDVERLFIERSAPLCGEDETLRCLCVRRRGRTDGILVVPREGGFVKMAAYIPNLPDI